MLRFLRVRNFALIDQLELHFEEGFNLLSGETGAGKSIIVDALGLLAGSKASGEMVRTGLGLWHFDPDGAGPKSGPAGVEGYSDLRFIFDSGFGLRGATAFVVVALALVMIGVVMMEHRFGIA